MSVPHHKCFGNTVIWDGYWPFFFAATMNGKNNTFWGIKLLTLFPLLHTNRTYIIYKKPFIEEGKVGRNSSKFTISKYRENGIEITNLFP